MKITYLDGCEQAWRASLTSWQMRELVALHRQGKHLRDRTNHGSDMRWAQAGVKVYDAYGTPRRTPRRYGHERVLIERTEFGYTVLFIRRTTGFSISPDTGAMHEHEVWKLIDTWHVGRWMSSNHLTDQLHSQDPQ